MGFLSIDESEILVATLPGAVRPRRSWFANLFAKRKIDEPRRGAAVRPAACTGRLGAEVALASLDPRSLSLVRGRTDGPQPVTRVARASDRP